MGNISSIFFKTRNLSVLEAISEQLDLLALKSGVLAYLQVCTISFGARSNPQVFSLESLCFD